MVRTYRNNANASNLGMFDQDTPRRQREQYLFHYSEHFHGCHEPSDHSTNEDPLDDLSLVPDSPSPPASAAKSRWADTNSSPFSSNHLLVVPTVLPPTQKLGIGLCHSCRQLYQADDADRQRSVDYNDLLNQKRREENSFRNGDSFIGGGMKGSISEGHLNPYDDDYDLGNGLSELSGTLARLQESATTMDDTMRFKSLPVSALNSVGSSSRSRSSRSADVGLGLEQMTKPVAGRRSRHEPQTKSGYRRELQQQMEEQRQRRQREEADIRAERFGGDIQDPMQHRRGQGRHRGEEATYSPSVYDQGPPKGARRGGNAPPPNHGTDRATYQRELQEQMAEQAARRDREKRDDNLDWWEKRPNQVVEESNDNATKRDGRRGQRPKQSDHPHGERKTYEDELKQQIHDRKQQQEEERRREREEDERLERKIREQQERMKAEYEAEQAKKKAKEEAKLKRQEDMMIKQRQQEEELERARREAKEQKQKERKQAAKNAAQAARDQSPPPDDFQGTQFRSNSPPIPSMRGKSHNDHADAADKLSSMREQLEKKQEEHNGVWNGLVEV